ncbi:dipeptidase [Bacillus sp. ISL-40]|uniref:dipeptidase n=1 Tax=unclassified Bacillus (in: firmicutes) TaxID=185979 RepID=UPI001BE9AC1A|nr:MULTISPECIES: dipeptidase [unclassified Bacillus (in: firmicutes)]MBT2697392.1 dipeptidase [Bacillus sp. ISL-40]MBT2723892.1 dipeptidase [Bacillus sp. ISL-46]MBT2741792.1 dipeptidase [Bacillus sp. ISL-77]
MNIIDLHCDALMKLQEAHGTLRFADAPELQTSKTRLQQGQIKVQCFAIFIEPEIKGDQKFQVVLEQIDYFYKEVLGKNPDMVHIKEWSDFDRLKIGQIGAMLTLEGVDPIGNDLSKLHILYQLGVRSVGLTWNQANLAADGAGEPRGAGLTLFGKEIVEFNNEHQILTDVSHLSDKGIWEVIELAKYPIASHSNARALCNHLRNLTDEQAAAMFAKGGLIHVVYNPPFVKEFGEVTIPDLVKHIDHFCSLGGVKQIGFGSDFDGISTFITNLEDASKSQNLINELLKYYSEEVVRGFAYQNFLDHRPGMIR